ncbi:MAG: rubredoxin [Alphaproteobacteria bacterium]|jgi:rubredoxin|nr:rubredoxin [Alphaproteobacteria bacterium]MDP6875190.1 rubredoxin [Alphaproteobacteria bacterium]
MAEQQNITWDCLSCSYRYDPAIGAPEDGIPPGTPFEDLPGDWTCPECGVYKGNFAASTSSARAQH